MERQGDIPAQLFDPSFIRAMARETEKYVRELLLSRIIRAQMLAPDPDAPQEVLDLFEHMAAVYDLGDLLSDPDADPLDLHSGLEMLNLWTGSPEDRVHWLSVALRAAADTSAEADRALQRLERSGGLTVHEHERLRAHVTAWARAEQATDHGVAQMN